MTVELQVTGLSCNLRCEYCYQHPMREAGYRPPVYDRAAVVRAIEAHGQHFTMFGGEPLVLPLEKLKDLWRIGLEKYGKNGVQTNGALITEQHLEAFRQYRVSVGMSIDGPCVLNVARSAGTWEKTERATNKSLWALDQLLAGGCYVRDGQPVMPSLIVTLSKANGRPEVRQQFIEWLLDLGQKGLRSLRLHPLETESQAVAADWGLEDHEVVSLLYDLNREFVSRGSKLRVEMLDDIRKLLQADDSHIVCIWSACDPYTTESVRGIDPAGQPQNCGRVNKDGPNWIKAEQIGFERQLALHRTPQERLGCADCRFFIMCKGYCPGSAVDGDWRNRSIHCRVLYQLFEDAEQALQADGQAPLSLANDRKTVESEMVSAWARGENPRLHRVVKDLRSGEPRGSYKTDSNGHGDHYDSSRQVHADAVQHTDAGTEEHGDVPHGDHGDHGDSIGGEA